MVDLDAPTCPFCPFSDQDASFVAQHIDFCHPEGLAVTAPEHLHSLASTNPTASPFSVDEVPADHYVDCPHGCGETVASAELSTHLDLHVAEDIALDGSGTDPAAYDPDLMSRASELPSDYEELLDLPSSRKSGKGGTNRDFARNNSYRTERARSPPRKIGPNGAKRLGVRFQLFGALEMC